MFTYWRRDRDSNPGHPHGCYGFQDRSLRPLAHPAMFSYYTEYPHRDLNPDPRSDMLPTSGRYAARSEGFLLKASNKASINKLSPCAPRFNGARLLFARKSLRLTHDIGRRVQIPIMPNAANGT